MAHRRLNRLIGASGLSGMAAFTTMWAGQLVSATGTRMTQFALGIWVWEVTGQATALAVMMFLGYGATALASPFAGTAIDRWPRRLSLLLSDSASAVIVVGVLLLFLTDTAAVWHLVVANALTGVFLAFQQPAYASTITKLVDRERFPRANAMMALSRSIPAVFAPMIAAALLTLISIETVVMVDVATYAIALSAVLIVKLPDIPRQPKSERAGIWTDAVFGFRYIARRRGLAILQSTHVLLGMLAAMGFIVLTPLIMLQSGDNAVYVGIVNSVGAVGGVVGGIVVAAIKSPARKVLWFVTASVIFSLFGRVLLGVGDSIWIWCFSMFCAWMCLPALEAYNQAIYQELVEPEAQGRVFAARQSLVQLSVPVAMATTGPLADYVLEPGMTGDGVLASTFGFVVGTGPGSGMALIFVLTGLLGAVIALLTYLSPAVRSLDEEAVERRRRTVDA